MTGELSTTSVTGMFDDVFATATAAVDKIDTKLGELRNKLSGGNIPAPLDALINLEAIQGKLDDIEKKIKKLIQLVKTAVKHHMPVLSLVYQSFNWIENISPPMSRVSAGMKTRVDENFAYWSGPAASAFGEKETLQNAAVDGIVDGSEFISSWLMDIARTNFDYLVELANFAADIAGAIIQAIIDAAGIISIPVAIDVLAEQVGQIVAKRIKNLVAVSQRFLGAVANYRTIVSRLNDERNFPSGGWPQAVAG